MDKSQVSNINRAVFFLVLLISITTGAQDFSQKMSSGLIRSLSCGPDQTLSVWIFFRDRGQGKKLQKPEELLSKESLSRRAKTRLGKEMGLADSLDIPPFYSYRQEIEKAGARIRHSSRYLNAVSADVSINKIPKIASLGCVERVELVQKYKRGQEETGTKAIKSESLLKTGGLNYGSSYGQLNQISVPALHDSGLTGKGVKICICDAGFNRLDHEVFKSMDIIARHDFVNNRSSVADTGGIGDGTHGTETLSVLGGYKPGFLIGPAYGASFILAKTENTVSETPLEEDNWIAAVEWADSIGADIVSSSLGYLEFDTGYPSLSWQDMNGVTAKITIAADIAAKKGIMVFNSAGNENFNQDHNSLGAPADGKLVLAIGAVDSHGTRASFSSVGNTTDGRIKPDLMAMGVDVFTANPSSTSSYSYNSGTSFSCPLAAGACALLIEKYPTLDPNDLRNALRNTASRNSSPDRLMGYGIIDVQKAMASLSETNVNKPETVSDFRLCQNYPNPFNPSTEIDFSTGERGFVRLSIYNILGQKICDLLQATIAAGPHHVSFDAGNYGLASGVYLYTLSFEGNIINEKKMIFIK